MALKSGLAAQVGFATESTVNVPVTATRFLPLVSESMGQKIERLESAGIIAGKRVLASTQWAAGGRTYEGDVQLEMYQRNMGQTFKHMFGSVVTAGAGPYTHTCTPGDLSGLSFTAQFGVPDQAGVVQPVTYSGCKVQSWELAVKQGEIATLGLTLQAMNEILYRTVGDLATNSNTAITSATAAFTADDIGKPVSGTNIPASTTIVAVTSATAATLSQNATGTGTGGTLVLGLALAAASYATLTPLHFLHGAVTIAGASVPVSEATISGDNGLDVDRRFLGQAGISEPLEAELRTYDGSLTCEFSNLTQYRRFLNASEVALVLTLTSGADIVTVTMNVRFDGETPAVDGTGIVGQPIPFKAVASGADSTAITVVLTNADAAI